MNNLQELEHLLSENSLLNFSNLDSDAIDEMLDSRDDSEFENDWLRTSELLESKDFAETDLAEIEKIREIVYKKTFASTKHSEIAAYASDDFELIAKALLSDFSDEWLNALFLSYLHGVFPHTKLAPKRNGIELILETASLQRTAV